MKFGQAVRLKELWNGSFHLTLAIKYNENDSYYLFGFSKETPPEMLGVLAHMSERLLLKMTINHSYYTVR